MTNHFKRGRKGRAKPKNQSIHPRVYRGRTRFKKVNTAKVAKPSKLENLVVALERHLERHPNDGVTANRLAALL